MEQEINKAIELAVPIIKHFEGCHLYAYLQKFAYGVLRLIKVKLEPHEHAALISFSYNLGLGNLQSSTLRTKLNRDERIAASNELPKWVRAGGRKLRGLVLRREAERELFLS